MDDDEIISRFEERSESAIVAVEQKYSRYCISIALGILGNDEDAKEVLNDTYSRVWNAIPPARPNSLRVFIGRIARNLSLDRLKKFNAERRGSGQLNAILSELEECLADRRNGFDELAESEAITIALNTFLSAQKPLNRRVFVRRYYRAASIEQIAEDFEMSVENVKTILFRMRNKLRKHLESEGVYL